MFVVQMGEVLADREVKPMYGNLFSPFLLFFVEPPTTEQPRTTMWGNGNCDSDPQEVELL